MTYRMYYVNIGASPKNPGSRSLLDIASMHFYEGNTKKNHSFNPLVFQSLGRTGPKVFVDLF